MAPSKSKIAQVFYLIIFATTLFIGSGQTTHSADLIILSGQSNMANWDPQDVFIPELDSLYPNNELLFVKVALGGQSIQQWYNVLDNPKRPHFGPLYLQLVDEIRAATSGKKLTTATLVWMQGEQDTYNKPAGVYQKSFQGLLRSLQAEVGIKLNVVIGRINDSRQDRYWEYIRNLEMKEKFNNIKIPWVDTDDLNGPTNDLHMTPEGYQELAHRFAIETAKYLK
jgi:hypothetical protein